MAARIDLGPEVEGSGFRSKIEAILNSRNIHCMPTKSCTDRQTDRQTDGQTDRHTDRQTDRRTDRQTDKGGK